MGIREEVKKVELAELLNELLWEAAFDYDSDVRVRLPRQQYPYYRLITTTKLKEKFEGEGDITLHTVLHTLERFGLCERPINDTVKLYLSVFNPMTVARALVGNLLKEADLLYFYMRSLRKRYRLRLNSRTAEAFSLFADAATIVIEAERKASRVRGSLGTPIDLKKDLLKGLRRAWSEKVPGTDSRSELKAFIEVCRVVNYFQVHHRPHKVLINTRRIDSEYLLSSLFGLTSSIAGFDDLFGGGGVMLTDDTGESAQPGIDGRKILVIGRYGSGKSLLSLQVAAEVARKGGVAWIMSMEQPAKECLYSLAAVGQYPDRRFVRVETNPIDAERALTEDDDRGLMIFVDNTKATYEMFLESLRLNAGLLLEYRAKYPLRLIVVDPINAIFRRRDIPVAGLRDETLKALDEVVKENTNIWLLSEDEGERELTFVFEQNIADTVIRLHNTRSHDYSLRFIEVSKSRMQREQRGWHPLSIKPQGGVMVVPAPAAVAARIRHRSSLHSGHHVRFGILGMDEILGSTGLTTGDVVVIHGPEGSLKTQMGHAFLFATDQPSEQGKGRAKSKSLLISAGEDVDKVRDDLKQTKARLSSDHPAKGIDDILVLSISKGYIQPGLILQLIERTLLEARQDGFVIDRVSVDDVRSWVLSCPFLREDATFGDTLVELFRKYGVTSCFICSEAATVHDSALQEMIVSNADCDIRLISYEMKGVANSIIKVAKTREMSHRRDLFSLSLTNSHLSVEPISSLLRVDNDGVIKPLTIRLFFHEETLGQELYNKHIGAVVKSTLSPATYIEQQSNIFLSSTTSLGKSAAIDELHVVQLDEFQMPSFSRAQDASIQLWRFSDDQWDKKLWGSLVDVFESRVRRRDVGFIGLPFFCNVGLLAYRPALVSKETINDWKSLAKECARWEKANPGDELFFDFPGETDENYNCLFWEILLVNANMEQLKGNDCILMKLLTSREALEAAQILRSIGRRSHLQKQFHRRQHSSSPLRGRISTNPKALVSRHWYTTLNEMLAGLEENTRQEISVSLMPGGVCVGGEWFVAIPKYSTAAEKGLELIKILTSREAELDRMVHGVGLPTRADFYNEGKESTSPGVVSPFFRLNKRDLGERIKSAFRRSQFNCYSSLSLVLSVHLKQILELPDLPLAHLRREVIAILNSLAETVRFVGGAGSGSKCVSCQSQC